MRTEGVGHVVERRLRGLDQALHLVGEADDAAHHRGLDAVQDEADSPLAEAELRDGRARTLLPQDAASDLVELAELQVAALLDRASAEGRDKVAVRAEDDGLLHGLDAGLDLPCGERPLTSCFSEDRQHDRRRTEAVRARAKEVHGEEVCGDLGREPALHDPIRVLRGQAAGH